MITIINNAWLTTGVGRYVDSIFSRFIKWGKDIEMIYFDNGRPYGRYDKRIKAVNGRLKKAELNNYFFLPRKIPKGRELYHVTNETIGVSCGYAKPAVGSCMDMVPYLFESNYSRTTSFFRKRQLFGLKKAEKIITISENTKKDFMRITKTPEEKVIPIHLGVDANFFRPMKRVEARRLLNLPPEKRIILHVGRDEPRKNIASILKAFSNLDKDILFLKVGGLSEQSSRLAEKLGLKGRIVEMSLEEKLMPAVYSSADAFIFPSYYEGFGLPVLEAMACGTPVVAANTSSLPEIVRDAGIMHGPDDVEAITSSVKEILENKAISKKFQLRGLKNAEKFSWDACAKKTWNAYESVLRK